MASYSLTAPDGTKVTVEGADRRDTLLSRGYSEGKAAGTSAKEKPVEVKAGSNDTVSVNTETKPTGRK